MQTVVGVCICDLQWTVGLNLAFSNSCMFGILNKCFCEKLDLRREEC